MYWLRNYRFFLWRFFALLFWVLCFESLTWALWINNNLWSYSYIYNDVSWIMTLTWSSMIMLFKFIFDRFCQKWNLLREFLFVIIFSSITGLSLLIYLKNIWVFSYSSEMQQIVSSWFTIFWRPLEALLYFPVFIFTVYSFYKYWELAMYNKNLFKSYKINYWKDLIIGGITIALIWYLMHPLLETNNVLNYLFLLFSLILILIVTNYVINVWRNLHLFIRFLLGSFVYAIWSLIVLQLFLSNKLISFSQSILNTFAWETPSIEYITIADVGWGWVLVLAYFIISIVKYFKIVSLNKDIVLDEKRMTFKGWESFYKRS